LDLPSTKIAQRLRMTTTTNTCTLTNQDSTGQWAMIETTNNRKKKSKTTDTLPITTYPPCI